MDERLDFVQSSSPDFLETMVSDRVVNIDQSTFPDEDKGLAMFEAVLTKCGYPPDSLQKDMRVTFRKLQAGLTTYDLTKKNDGSIEMLRRTQAIIVNAYDGENKKLVEVLYERPHRKSRVNSHRLPAKTIAVQHMSEEEIAVQAKEILQTDMGIPDAEFANIFTGPGEVQLVQQQPEPSETFAGMVTERLLGMVTLRTETILPEDRLFINHEPEFGITFYWAFRNV